MLKQQLLTQPTLKKLRRQSVRTQSSSTLKHRAILLFQFPTLKSRGSGGGCSGCVRPPLNFFNVGCVTQLLFFPTPNLSFEKFVQELCKPQYMLHLKVQPWSPLLSNVQKKNPQQSRQHRLQRTMQSSPPSRDAKLFPEDTADLNRPAACVEGFPATAPV